MLISFLATATMATLYPFLPPNPEKERFQDGVIEMRNGLSDLYQNPSEVSRPLLGYVSCDKFITSGARRVTNTPSFRAGMK